MEAKVNVIQRFASESMRLDRLPDARKTHPNLASTGIDIIVLKKISDMISKNVKNFNDIIKNTNSLKKQINDLKIKNDPANDKIIEDLTKDLEQKNNDIKDYDKKISGGDIAKEVITSIRNTDVRNPENAIRENLQLVGYEGKELNIVTKDSAYNYVQMLVIKKFKHNSIREEFSKKNVNFFDVKNRA